MRTGSRTVLIIVVLLAAATAIAGPAAAQTDARPFVDGQTPTLFAPLPPATALEGFRAPLGAILTVGHEQIGEVKGISVGVRELRDSNGGRVRGAVVEVTGDKNAPQLSYVDD